MSRSISILLTTCTLLLSLAGCARVSEEELPFALQVRPVLFSILSPGISPRVTLCRTTIPGQASDTLYYPSARVFMWEKGHPKTELSRQSSTAALYTDQEKQLNIEPGKTYLLQAIIGQDTLSAQTTVPAATARIKSGIYQAVDTDGGYFRGTFRANLANATTQPCLLTVNDMFAAEDKGTFLGSNEVVDFFSVADSLPSLKARLFCLDAYLANYWSERAISVRQMHYSGDLSVFIGTFSGVLPPYSNIQHGFGLFGSYTTDTATIQITRP